MAPGAVGPMLPVCPLIPRPPVCTASAPGAVASIRAAAGPLATSRAGHRQRARPGPRKPTTSARTAPPRCDDRGAVLGEIAFTAVARRRRAPPLPEPGAAPTERWAKGRGRRYVRRIPGRGVAHSQSCPDCSGGQTFSPASGPRRWETQETRAARDRATPCCGMRTRCPAAVGQIASTKPSGPCCRYRAHVRAAADQLNALARLERMLGGQVLHRRGLLRRRHRDSDRTPVCRVAWPSSAVRSGPRPATVQRPSPSRAGKGSDPTQRAPLAPQRACE